MALFKKNKEQNKETIKTPWYKFYNESQLNLNYPDISLYKFMEDSAKETPNNKAYNYFGKEVTYHEFLNQIEMFARSLKALGVKKDDVITICMPNTPEAIIMYYAINKIGAISNMIHPLSGENEIKYYLQVSNSKIIVTIDMACEKVEHIKKETNVEKVIVLKASGGMPTLLSLGYGITKGRKIKTPKKNSNILFIKDFLKLGEGYIGETYCNTDGNQVCSILYSGGTTGKPKGIVLTNYNLNAVSMQGFEACQKLEEKDKLLAIMPIFHGFGLGVCIHTVLTHKAEAILIPQFSAKDFHKLIKKYKPNFLIGVPTLYEALINNKDMKNVDLSYLKCAISGGDNLHVSLKKKVDDFFSEHNAKIEIREGYGLTECVCGTCLNPHELTKAGSIGIPYPGTLYKIVKPNTQITQNYNEEGEIVISGPTVMREYLNEEKETFNTLQLHEDGRIWLHTGDLGYMDEDGFIFFKQRIKRMIVSSGYNVYPSYVENIISELDYVTSATVIGIPHPYKIEVPKAFIVLKEGVMPTEKLKEEILEHCRKNLAKFSIPYEIEFRETLPKTLVGKIDFMKLKKEEDEK